MPGIWNTSNRKKGILNSTSYGKWKKAERREEGHWLFQAVRLDFSQKAIKIVKMNLHAIWMRMVISAFICWNNLCAVHSLLDSGKEMVMTPSTHRNPHLCMGDEVVSIIKTTIHSGDPKEPVLMTVSLSSLQSSAGRWLHLFYVPQSLLIRTLFHNRPFLVLGGGGGGGPSKVHKTNKHQLNLV
jgi:hypothetical protein